MWGNIQDCDEGTDTLAYSVTTLLFITVPYSLQFLGASALFG